MSDTIKALASHLVISPASIAEYTLDKMQAAMLGDIDINEPSSPFMQLIQANAVNTAAAILRNDHADRKRYPNLAVTIDELLPHLNSDDLVDIFSSPVRNHTVNLSFSIVELIENAIEDEERGISVLEIPADTQLTCSGYGFMFHQPIEIRITPSGYISAVFKDEFDSPLLQRAGNKIPVNTYTYDKTEFFNMAIPCDQLSIVSHEEAIVTGQPWSISSIIEDKFTYARGWYYTTIKGWVEMDVKFDRTFYDATNPTMILELLGDSLNAYIPDIYIANNLVGSKVRVDIYSTKGYSSISLGSKSTADWEVDFQDYSNLSGVLDEPLFNVGTRIVFSDDKTTGGTNGMSFDQIRRQVIYGDGIKLGAYTREELAEVLQKRGYRGVLRKETLGGRVYVANRSVDNPSTLPSTGLSSGVGVTNALCIFDEESTSLPRSMITNVTCSVIKPEALYSITDAVATILTDADRKIFEDQLDNGNRETLVDALNAGTYAWTQFHTVLDYRTPVFRVRQYNLNSPTYKYISVGDNNWLMGYSVDTSSINVELVGNITDNTMVAVNESNTDFYSDVDLTKRDNYSLQVHGTFPKGVNNLHAQLVMVYEGENYYLDSTVVQATETDAIFTFELFTNLDLDIDNNFSVVMYNLATKTEMVVKINLETEFGIVYLAETNTVMPYLSIDNFVNKSLYKGGLVSTINVDYFGIDFGDHMDGLFNYGRTLLRSTVYQKHTANKQAVWSKDIPKRTADGDLVFVIDDSVTPNKIDVELLFEAGEPRVDVAGDPVWEYEIGDLVIDADKKPIPIPGSGNEEVREVRFHLLDAKFRYTSTDAVLDYVAEIPTTILGYITKDIAALQKEVTDFTDLYYEPLATNNYATVVTEDSSEGILANLSIAMSVNFQLTREGYLDESFKASIRTLTKSVVVDQLNTGIISTTVLRKALYDLDRDKIQTISLTTPFGSDVYAYVKNNDGAFSLGKKLFLEPNDTITISDTLVINFSK